MSVRAGGRGEGALPPAWDQQFHFVCRPHFPPKQQIAFTLRSVCLSTWVENRQPNSFPSWKCSARGSDGGGGQGDGTCILWFSFCSQRILNSGWVLFGEAVFSLGVGFLIRCAGCLVWFVFVCVCFGVGFWFFWMVVLGIFDQTKLKNKQR